MSSWTEHNCVLIPCKQHAFYHVFHTQRVKFRLATTNKGALFEMLSFSLVQCTFTYSRLQYIFGSGLLQIQQSFSLLFVVKLIVIIVLWQLTLDE